MSRVGKLPITIPSGVDIDIAGTRIKVKGPRGTLERDLTPVLSIVTEDGQLRVVRPNEDKRSRELHGLTRTLINNMVVGVTDGYTRNLEIQGVGYRAQLVGRKLQLNLGHLKELKSGNSIEEPVYSFQEHNRTKETRTIHPTKVIIVEGILILTHTDIRDM
ncbi:MAG: 50S ribosomal protein L6, partial [Candidatus Limnocylindrales bacterium]